MFWVILALFANFEAERAQNSPKNDKFFFSNVNQNNLYFPFLVSDQQVVKIVSPYCTCIAGYGLSRVIHRIQSESTFH
jgi:hypothetical protein